MDRTIVKKEQRQTNDQKYNFKFWQELGWGILVAIIVTLAQAFIQFDASAVVNWQVWALSIISGCARAIAVIVVKTFTDEIIFTKE